ncbi:hypothetical protein, partial [Herbaspirillum rubrisubalbicans]|uniref:hypothetical protein n=1 Tax=Herbaspirillum rubrisubalbicans TaxID=80842 RepID=UPI001C130A4F
MIYDFFISVKTQASRGMEADLDRPGSGAAKLFSIIFEKGLARCGVGCYSSPPADATHEAKL